METAAFHADTSTDNRNILVVEDEYCIRETVRMALEYEGYSVYAAGNGKEGLELLERVPQPGLILLDLTMPVMSGKDFIDRLKEDRRFDRIPIIVMTAFRDHAAIEGANEMLFKPIDLSVLFQKIRQWSSKAAGALS